MPVGTHSRHQKMGKLLMTKWNLWACCGLSCRFLLLLNVSVAISVNPHVCFIFIVLILVSMFTRYYTYELGSFHADWTSKCLMNQIRTKGESWSTENLLSLSVIFYCWPAKGSTSVVVNSSGLFYVLLLLCLFIML